MKAKGCAPGVQSQRGAESKAEAGRSRPWWGNLQRQLNQAHMNL